MMNTKQLSKSTFAVVVALLFCATVHAQRGGRGGRGNVGGGNPIGNPMAVFGPLLGTSQLLLSSMTGTEAQPEPTRTNFVVLLKRSDVYAELVISSSQREKLQDLEKNTEATIMQDFQAQFSTMGQKIQELRQSTGKRPTQEEMQPLMAEIAKEAASNVNDSLDETDDKIAGVLNKKQLARLRQIDFQFRTVLALSDGKVAEKFLLTPDQLNVVMKSLESYRKEQTDSLSTSLGGFGGANSGAGRRGGNVPNLGSDDMKDKLNKAAKKLTVTRTTLAMQLEDELTDDQLAIWKEMIGKKFTFRSQR